MFSNSRPQFIEAPKGVAEQAMKAMVGSDKAAEAEIRLLSIQPLPASDQAAGKAIGFFEQGLLLGASILFFVVLPFGSYLSWKFLASPLIFR